MYKKLPSSCLLQIKRVILEQFFRNLLAPLPFMYQSMRQSVASAAMRTQTLRSNYHYTKKASDGDCKAPARRQVLAQCHAATGGLRCLEEGQACRVETEICKCSSVNDH